MTEQGSAPASASSARALTAKLGSLSALRSAPTAGPRPESARWISAATARDVCVGPSSTTSASRATSVSSSPTDGSHPSSQKMASASARSPMRAISTRSSAASG